MTHLVPFNLFGKRAEFVVTEALAIQYAAENTTIPVPRVLYVIGSGSAAENFLLTTGVKELEYGPMGVTLDRMPEDKRVMFAETLRGWFEQLRCLPPPDDHTTSGFTGMGVMSYRIGHPLSVHSSPKTSFMLRSSANHGNSMMMHCGRRWKSG